MQPPSNGETNAGRASGTCDNRDSIIHRFRIIVRAPRQAGGGAGGGQ
jgi:hypothetical protein